MIPDAAAPYGIPTSSLEAIVSINRYFQKSSLADGMGHAAATSEAYMNDALDEMRGRP